MLQLIIEQIHKQASFVITSHMKPDCDALGSELALAEHLEALGKRVAILNNDPTPANYRFLDPQKRIRRYSPKRHNGLIDDADAIIVVDASGDWSRVGSIGAVLRQATGVKLCIDHHPDATDFVDLAWVDTQTIATGELIYQLITKMDGDITHTIAQALYAAIITDSGNFRFPNTTPRTHRIVAQLLEAGVSPSTVYSNIYERTKLGAIKLRGYTLNSLQTSKDGQIAYYTLSKNMLKAYGVKPEELDGFASLGQQIQGVRVTIFCLEAANQKVKISLRSDGSIAINHIAQAYGGGGHPSAAGALVSGTLEDVMADLVEKVQQAIYSQAPS
jgi:phosphoesterase RecJ-like protein